MAKKKYYVVWSGKKTGIFETWDECREQVNGVKGARYKSFESREEAKKAFNSGYSQTSSAPNNNGSAIHKQTIKDHGFIEESISVDAACSGNPGDMEYRGVYTKNGKELFHYGPVPNGTNNIGEYLAIVHALALMKQKNSHLPVYSDSQTAIGWVRKKQVNTTIPRDKSTEHLWDAIDRATNWLRNNKYTNEILKWETKWWGESKADYGRK